MAASQSKNYHLTDPVIQAFLSPDFSPIDYLNSSLPSLAPSASTSLSKPQQPSLSSIASQTQSQISTLNAQTTRLSTTLTNLTDDILRTSSRLAYEVELLRGEALSLADSLSSRGDLHEHILQFVPNGLDSASTPSEPPSSPVGTRNGSLHSASPVPTTTPQIQAPPETTSDEPSALPHLRTLLHVRTQLQSVIQRFNLALSFPMPPSLVTTATSSLITVAAPNRDLDLESKGQAALSRLKQEVTDMLERGEVENAQQRVAELRDVCVIWKGTGEERARGRWVDGLEAIVDGEIQRKEDGRRRGGTGNGQAPGIRREGSAMRSAVNVDAAADTGRSGTPTGFLRRLRDEIYME